MTYTQIEMYSPCSTSSLRKVLVTGKKASLRLGGWSGKRQNRSSLYPFYMTTVLAPRTNCRCRGLPTI